MTAEPVACVQQADGQDVLGGREGSWPSRRDLDGVYFRVERDGRWLSLCLTDLTEAERERVTEGRSPEWLRDLALVMARTLREMGDQLGVVCEAGEVA